MRSRNHDSKTRHLILFLLFSGLGALQQIQACSCAAQPEDFCSSVRDVQYIALVEILEIASVDKGRIKILTNIHQEIVQDEVTLIGSNGLNCAEPLDTFQVGDTLLMALYLEYGSDSNYELSNCGRHFLNYKNGILEGKVSPDVTNIAYEALVEDLENCLLLVASENISLPQIQVELYPNPLQEELIIRSTNSTIKHLQVFNISGQIIAQNKGLNHTQAKMQVQQLVPGLYFIRIETTAGIIIKRLQKS
mgnify:CR=1 FL=1